MGLKIEFRVLNSYIETQHFYIMTPIYRISKGYMHKSYLKCENRV